MAASPPLDSMSAFAGLLGTWAALLAGFFAWVNFEWTVRAQEKQKQDALRDYIAALRAELETISPWTDREYPSLDRQRYFDGDVSDLADDWHTPSSFRYLLPSTSTISAFAHSAPAEIRADKKLAIWLGNLATAISRFRQLHDRVERFILADPRLAASIHQKQRNATGETPPEWTEKENRFQHFLFDLNYTLHVQGISTRNSLRGLAGNVRGVREQLDRFEQQLTVRRTDWMRIIGWVLAFAFLALAALLTPLWIDVLVSAVNGA